jgi:NADH-quinone oxidoreductase subunit A
MSPYIGILGMVALGVLFVGAMVGSSLLLGPRRYNRAKYDSFECGVQPTPRPSQGNRVDVKYYVPAMLFIVFDIEIVFLYPWAVTFDQLGIFAVVEMILFIITVFVAYLYVLRRGGLTWD